MIRVLLLLLILYITRAAVYYGIRKNKTGEYDKLNEIFLNTGSFQKNADLLIIGSSTAESHLYPQIIDSIAGVSAYNAGMQGATLPFAQMIYEAWIKNHPVPGYLVVNIDIHTSSENQDTIHDFPKYFPYLSNDVLYDHLRKWDSRFFAFKYLSFYSLPYTSYRYFNASVRGYLDKPVPGYEEYNDGFYPTIRSAEKPIDSIPVHKYRSPLFESRIKALERLAASAAKNGSELVFVVSPICNKEHSSFEDLHTTNNNLAVVAEKLKVPLFNYVVDSVLSQPRLFADMHHLKKEGAKAFSTRFSADFEQYFKK